MSRSLQVPYTEPLPVLGKAERSRMLQEAYASYEQLFTAIRIARSGNGNPHANANPNGTALGGVSGKTTGTVMMCTTTTITGTLEEVAELYTAADSHYILDFAQSARLYELEAPTHDSPLRCVGLRYSRWASISSLVTDRDLLYLETMDEFVDRKTGRRGWARCTKSIVHRSCPPSQHPNGPIRAELYVMGMVVRETATLGLLELITLVHANVKNRIPSWITRTVLKRRKKNALSLSHVLKVRRRVRDGGSTGNGSSRGGNSSQIGDFTGASHTSSEDDASKDKRACKGCVDYVSRWSRSYKCRKCNELICKSCATMTYFDTDTQELRNRICADCSFGTLDEDAQSTDGETYYEPEPEARVGRDANTKAHAASKAKKKHKKKKKQHARDKNSEENHRQRTYSHLSVDSQTYGTTTSTVPEEVEEEGEGDDLGSTMHRLDKLNASATAPSIDVVAATAARPPTTAETSVSATAPPTLRRKHSGNHRGSNLTHHERPVHEPRQRHRSDEPRPVARKSKPDPLPTPMTDLSYLQSFAAPKPSIKADPVGVRATPIGHFI